MFRVLFTDLATTRIMLRITCVLNMLALLSSFALSILFSGTEIPYQSLISSMAHNNWIAFDQGLVIPLLILSIWYGIRYIYLVRS